MKPASKSSHSLAVHGALFSVQIFFGLWPVAGAAVLKHLSPPAMIGLRTILAAPILIAIARVRAPGRVIPDRRDLAVLAILAFLGVTANQLLYAEGLLRAGPVSAAVLMVTIPPLTLLVAMIAGRERPRANRVIGVVVALLGAALVLPIERFELSSRVMIGDLLLIANCMSYACYLVFARGVIGRVGPEVAIAWVFLFGSIEALPFTMSPLLETSWSELPGWTHAILAFIVLGPTVGAYGLNGFALRHADASLVAAYVTLQPVIAGFAAWLLLGTEVTVRVAAAGLVIVAGLLIASRNR
jgi:drug/metabolite transporter (DMT)-like permease